MDNRLACRMGFYSSAFAVALGLAYLVVLGAYFGTHGLAFPPTPLVQMLGGIITFLTVPALLVIFVAIREVAVAARAGGGVLGTLGVCFAVLFAAVVSINRFVQLTVIRLAPSGPESADLARFLPYSGGSIMFALEMLGWGFFIALAALAVAPLFRGGRLETAIRWTLVAFALISLVSVAGYATGSVLGAVGFLAWGPLLTVLVVLLMVFFGRAGAKGADA